MFRTLSTIGLALMCAAPCAGSMQFPAAAFVLHAVSAPGLQETPEQRAQADRARTAQYLQQRKEAALSLHQALKTLDDDLRELLRLKETYPDDKELDSAIAQLRKSVGEFEPSATAASAPLQRTSDLAALADEAQRLSQIAAQAQNSEMQGHEMAAQITQRLAAPAPPPPSPSTAPAPSESGSGAPSGQPRDGRGHHPTGGVSRSPASVPEDSVSSPPSEKAGSPPPSSPAVSGDAEAAWYARLANGRLHYSVPDLMLWKVPSTVTVRIDGEKDAASAPLQAQTGDASIKVSRHMKVLVSAPENPSEFVITPESDTTLVQYVPEDGPTTWHFSVTPRYTAKEQKLVVHAWVLYDAANTQRELPVYNAVVNVHIPTLGECLKRMIQGDPDYWVKYGMPGGAGFIFVSGLVVGGWKWYQSRKKKVPVAP